MLCFLGSRYDNQYTSTIGKAFRFYYLAVTTEQNYYCYMYYCYMHYCYYYHYCCC